MPETGNPSATSGDVEALRDTLLETFREALERPDFGPGDRFLESGGDSLTVMEVILDLEKRHGVALSAAEFMALDSADSLARHVAAQERDRGAVGGAVPRTGDPRRSVLSVVQPGARLDPLVCAYGQSGEAAYAIRFAGLLPKDRPVAYLHVSEEQALVEGVRPLREIARDDARHVLERYPDRPCALAGFSLGAHVALALGHELAAQGVPPAFIAVLDDQADLERRHFGALRQEMEPRSLGELHALALQCSPAEPLATRVIYFRSAENEAHYRSDPTSGWGEIATGGVTLVDVSASHHEVPRASGLRQIVPQLMEELAGPRPQAPPPSAAQTLRYRARRAAREGDLSTEIALAETAIEQDREQPAWFYANLAAALFQKDDTTAALGALDDARRRTTWPLALDLRFLGEFQKRGLDDEREAVVRRLSLLESDHPSVNMQMAQAYLKLGLREEAARAVDAGLAMAPNHFRLSGLLIRRLRQEAAWPELLRVSERLVGTYPTNRRFRAALIDASTETGTPQRALEFHDAITSASPPDHEGLTALGRASLRRGQAAEALELTELALQESPKRPGLHLLRRNCLLALGRQEEADEAQLRVAELKAAAAES